MCASSLYMQPMPFISAWRSIRCRCWSNIQTILFCSHPLPLFSIVFHFPRNITTLNIAWSHLNDALESQVLCGVALENTKSNYLMGEMLKLNIQIAGRNANFGPSFPILVTYGPLILKTKAIDEGPKLDFYPCVFLMLLLCLTLSSNQRHQKRMEGAVFALSIMLKYLFCIYTQSWSNK